MNRRWKKGQGGGDGHRVMEVAKGNGQRVANGVIYGVICDKVAGHGAFPAFDSQDSQL